MNQYYKASVKMQFEDKKGNLKYRKENYFVLGISPTDVEKKLSDHLQTADYEITSISVSNVIDVIK